MSDGLGELGMVLNLRRNWSLKNLADSTDQTLALASPYTQVDDMPQVKDQMLRNAAIIAAPTTRPSAATAAT